MKEYMSYEEYLEKNKDRHSDRRCKLPGITNIMLTNTLRDLEKDGLIVREQFNEIPPHVEYSFSDMGRDLLPVFYSILAWGFKHERHP